MARTLNDSVIIAMIEAATRLSGARGPIAGAAHTIAGATAEGTQTRLPGQDGGAAATETGASTVAGEQPHLTAEIPPANQHDTRTADQIAVDFKTIYQSIEEVVKASAEQETKTVGFGIR
ncbi:MAG: hypothetical protein HY332_21785 [Chloroflexi bacterium]|nr:hypothetical protein [Chloroflexota bacterium]